MDLGIRRIRAKKDRYAKLLTYHSPRQIDRRFLISLRQRYLYCPVAKVANSSIKAFLYEAELKASGGLQKAAAEFTTREVHNALYGPLLLPYQLPNDLLQRALFGEHFVRILVVRNPADRLVSCYLDRVRAEGSLPHRAMLKALDTEDPDRITFDRFVGVIADQRVKRMNPHWRPIYHEACCDAVDYTNIAHFENLHTEMRNILDAVYPGVAKGIDLTVNRSPTKTGAKERVREFVTPALKAKIEKIYAKDYETFGY